MIEPGRKTHLFTFSLFKRSPELIPVAVLPISAAALGVVYIIYGLFTKPDVIINKKEKLPPWERVDPEKTTKVMRIAEQYKVNPDLEKLKKEIGDR